MNLTKWALVISALSCMYSCTVNPVEETDYASPVFTDSLHFAVVKTTNKVEFGFWGDPRVAESRSSVLYVNVSTGETTILYQTGVERENLIASLSCNHSDTTLTVQKRGTAPAPDTLLKLGLNGAVRGTIALEKYYTDFKGWFSRDTEYPRIISPGEIAMYNVTTATCRAIAPAWDFAVIEGRIAYWTDTSTFIYANDTVTQVPFSVTSLCWIHDAAFAFRQEYGPIVRYAIQAAVCDTLMQAGLTLEEYAISPDGTWMVYTEYDPNAELSGGFLKTTRIP